MYIVRNGNRLYYTDPIHVFALTKAYRGPERADHVTMGD